MKPTFVGEKEKKKVKSSRFSFRFRFAGIKKGNDYHQHKSVYWVGYILAAVVIQYNAAAVRVGAALVALSSRGRKQKRKKENNNNDDGDDNRQAAARNP